MSGRFRPHLWIVALLSRIVPRRFRSEWKQEWRAELEYRESRLAPWRSANRLARWDLIRRSCSAFWDALWLQPRRLEEEVFQDVRYGIRMLFKQKAFTLVALSSLALGIGANTALFSIIDAIILRPLPVEKPEDLVLFNWTVPGKGIPNMTLSGDWASQPDPKTGRRSFNSFLFAAFDRFRMQDDLLSDVFAFARLEQLTIASNGAAEIGGGQLISGGYFKGLGVGAAWGRTIIHSDDDASAPPVAMISHRYWERRFNRHPGVIGETVHVNGVGLTIVGVTPEKFSGTLQVTDSPDLYAPMALEPRLRPRQAFVNQPLGAWWVQIMGRRNPGVRNEQVRDRFAGVFEQTVLESWSSPDSQAARARVPVEQAPVLPQFRLDVVSGSHGLREYRDVYAEPLRILGILMVLVLIIACGNVAGLLLARAATRRKEIAARLAMGASRLRIVRQLLTESIVLALLSGVLGTIFANWGRTFLLEWGPWGRQPLVDARMDLRVLGFTIATALLTGILFGLAPALRSIRMDLMPAIADDSRTATPSRSRLGRGLLIVQVALTVMLLVGAGLFVQTLRNLRQVNPGFEAQNLVLFTIFPRLANFDLAKTEGFAEQIVRQIEGIPGVESVSVSNQSLATGGANGTSAQTPDGKTILFGIVATRSNFFETMRMPLQAGRALTPRDNAGAPKVFVVNEAFAREHFPNSSAVGATIKANGEAVEIVGVVRDAKFRNVREDVHPVAYGPYSQMSLSLYSLTFAVRTAADLTFLAPAIRESVRRIDPTIPVWNLTTQQQAIERTLTQERLFANLGAAFGIGGLLLTCIGLYGLMSYSVACRTREIGIRMALGATRRNVILPIMREAALIVSTGMLAGFAGGQMLVRALATVFDKFLYRLQPNDPVVLAVAIAVVTAVTLLAGYVPARRASLVDSTIALRCE